MSAIQPDVIGLVATWLRSIAPGSGIEGLPLLEHEDDGRHQPPFALLESAGFLRDPGVPAYLPYRLAITVYGRTGREADTLYRALTDLLHGAVNVLADDGTGFWSAQDETGPQPGAEGRWPVRTGITALYMPDRAIS